MNRYGLKFIKDKDLYNHVAESVAEYSSKVDLDKFNANLIDPIKLTFDSVIYRQSIEEIIESEVIRQLDKTNSNTIGYFHQNIFKYFGGGWSVPSSGYDVVHLEKKVFCELKNKHNTMNSSSSAKTYIRMQSTLINDPEATCMLVEVIAPHSRNTPWSITIEGEKQPTNEKIRRVSMDQFYAIVTGEKDAFAQFCAVLPKVIKDVVSEIGIKSKNNSVLSELNDISSDLLTSLYLLAFEKYEGFTNFKVKK